MQALAADSKTCDVKTRRQREPRRGLESGRHAWRLIGRYPEETALSIGLLQGVLW